MQADLKGAVMNIQGMEDSTCEKEQSGESEDEQMDPCRGSSGVAKGPESAGNASRQNGWRDR